MAQYRTVTEFLTKIRDEYTGARIKYTALNDELDNLNSEWQRDLNRGWFDMKIKKDDTVKYENKKRELQKQILSLIDDTNTKFNEIKTEADTVFGVFNRATGEKLDIATLELLKSGILSNDELKALANDFNGNITMLRLIGKYAEERAKNDNNANEEMKTLSNACKNAKIPYNEPIDSLIYWSQQGLRKDRALSDGIAKKYDEQADEIISEADGIFVQVGE